MKCFVDFLYTAAPHQRQVILKTLSNDQLKLLTEIIYNTAMDIIPIPDKDKKLLRKHRRNIRATLAQGISKQQRRRRLLTLNKILPVFIRHYLKWQDN